MSYALDMQVHHHSEAQPQPDAREIFTGTVRTLPIVGEGGGERLILSLVSFSAGGRTRWHRHSFEQGLVIIEGRGIVATEAAEQIVLPGDVVYVPANEKHWHGGTGTTAMAHIAINQRGETTVLEPVERIRSET
jgi:quercetin dioxygenase-like cupin family protein